MFDYKVIIVSLKTGLSAFKPLSHLMAPSFHRSLKIFARS